MKMHDRDSRIFVDERLLTERFGLSRRHWQCLRQRGEGPTFYRVGRRVLYDPAEVEAWLREHRAGGDDAD